MNVIEKLLSSSKYSEIRVINKMKDALKELQDFSMDIKDNNIVYKYEQLIKDTLNEITKEFYFEKIKMSISDVIPLECNTVFADNITSERLTSRTGHLTYNPNDNRIRVDESVIAPINYSWGRINNEYLDDQTIATSGRSRRLLTDLQNN